MGTGVLGGCIGVSMKGTQEASRSVASLPSMSPLRIAVIGRQKLSLQRHLYLLYLNTFAKNEVRWPVVV